MKNKISNKFKSKRSVCDQVYLVSMFSFQQDWSITPNILPPPAIILCHRKIMDLSASANNAPAEGPERPSTPPPAEDGNDAIVEGMGSLSVSRAEPPASSSSEDEDDSSDEEQPSFFRVWRGQVFEDYNAWLLPLTTPNLCKDSEFRNPYNLYQVYVRLGSLVVPART